MSPNLKLDKVTVSVVALSLSIAVGSIAYSMNEISSYKEDIERVTLDRKQVEETLQSKVLENEELVVSNSDLKATVDDLTALKEEQDQLIKDIRGRLQTLEERAKLQSVSRGATYTKSSNDLTKPSGVTEERINEVLKDTNLNGLGKYYIQAEQQYGISAKFLVGLSIEESGWGRSNIAKTKNNLFGFQAYTNDTSKASTFSSKGECILYVGKYIAENYLSPNGKYYNGVTVESVHVKYADNPKWASNIKAHMNRF